MVVGEGAQELNQGLGRLGRGALSGEELGAFWWRQAGRPKLGEERFPELRPLQGPPRVFWLKKRET